MEEANWADEHYAELQQKAFNAQAAAEAARQSKKPSSVVAAAEAKYKKVLELLKEAEIAAGEYREGVNVADRAYQALLDSGKSEEDDEVAKWGAGTRATKADANAFRETLKAGKAGGTSDKSKPTASKVKARPQKPTGAKGAKDMAMLKEATQHTDETLVEQAGELGIVLNRVGLRPLHTDIPVSHPTVSFLCIRSVCVRSVGLHRFHDLLVAVVEAAEAAKAVKAAEAGKAAATTKAAKEAPKGKKPMTAVEVARDEEARGIRPPQAKPMPGRGGEAGPSAPVPVEVDIPDVEPQEDVPEQGRLPGGSYILEIH